MAFKKPTKNEFFCLLLTVGTCTSVFKNSKPLRSHKRVYINFFSIILIVNERIRIRTSYLWTYDLSGPVRNAFDASKLITRQVGGGWAMGIETFLSPIK